MTYDEFPAELVRDCRAQFSAVLVDLNFASHVPDGLKDEIIIAILRESKHAELVAAMKAIKDDPDASLNIVLYAQTALKAVGET